MNSPPPVALVTFSTRPRGGAVHTLHLAEALAAQGQLLHVFALGDPAAGFFRPTDLPCTVIQAPPSDGTLEDKVWRSVDVLAARLEEEVPGRFEVIHAQDCIAARAACRVRDAHPALSVVRTVHHIDEFTTPALIECQHRSIRDPDHLLVVSRYWQGVIRKLYGIGSALVTNGVDADRFERPPYVDRGRLRTTVAAGDRTLLLSVGGVEPRKGSLELFEALAYARPQLDPPPLLVVIGGHSFRDHSAYREHALGRAQELGLREGRDYVLTGTVSEQDLVGWYHSADALVFPSVNEGWGLAVLEAMAAGLPVLTTDIDVFREYLDDETALLVPPADVEALSGAIVRLARDPALRRRLGEAGPAIARRFSWQSSAAQHMEIYRAAVRRTPAA